MGIKLGLAGDTMLGRMVAQHLGSHPPSSLVHPAVVEEARRADLFVLNLECCISDRGSRWPDPVKPFFFRAPPVAVEALALLGVDCVTLANNHALDYGDTGLLDTLEHLGSAGIRVAGAGPTEEAARAPAVVESGGFRLAVVGLTDHPRDFAAGPDTPGVAFADLRSGMPGWVSEAVDAGHAAADAVLVTPHWGPNMSPDPVPHVRAAARALVEAGATLVAGHSAHVFQGARGGVLFDLGDFLDDYATDPALRNDLGLLWMVDLEPSGPVRIEALPLELEYCHTRPATGENAEWIRHRLTGACAPFATAVAEEDGRLVVAVDTGRGVGS